MKTTKKILMILAAIAVLVCTVFACVTSAVVAGEATSVDEYLTMKKSAEDNFENGTSTSFSNAANLNKVDPANKALVAGVRYWSEFRKGAVGVYDDPDALSEYFYTFDYNYNNGSHVYIEPIFGVLNDIERTPTKGFVSEFDIGFFSPLIEKTRPAFDANGDPIMEEVKENGKVVTEPVLYKEGEILQVVAYDERGNIKYDSNNKVVMEDAVDDYGFPIYAKAGDPKMVPLYNEDGTVVLNKDGSVAMEGATTPKMQQATEVVMQSKVTYARDNDGEPIWIEYTGADGQPVREPKLAPVWEEVRDEKGQVVLFGEGAVVMKAKYDANGQLVRDENGIIVLEPDLDKSGNVQYHDPEAAKLQLAESPVYTKGAFQDLSSKFEIDMQNTQTYKDGRVQLLRFQTKASDGTVTVTVLNNVDSTATTTYTFGVDEWCHFTIQFVAETSTVYVYVGKDTDEGGRKLVCQANAFSEAENKGGAIVPVYPLRLRMGCSAKAGIVCIDNVLGYQGTTVHDPDFIDKLDDEDPDGMFRYFMSVLTNESANATSRFSAYGDIGEYVISNYYNNGNYTAAAYRDQTLRDLVDIYNDYKANKNGIYDKLVSAMCDENAKTYAMYVGKITATERKLENTAERSSKVAIADEFLASCGSNINKSSDAYLEANALHKEAKAALAADIASNEFIHNMELFINSVNYGSSSTRVQYHYKNASIYRAAISNPEELSATDAAKLRSAITNYDGNGTTVLPADQVITNNIAEWNSQRFVQIIDLIKLNGSGTDDYANDDGTIETLWRLALEIIRGNDGPYNSEYAGFAEAEIVFNTVHSYFWTKLQDTHIALLSAKLDGFNAANSSYIDKAGICNYVTQYFAANEADIDPENTAIATLRDRNETYKTQLSTLETDYNNLLTQNTIKFVNVMNYMAEFEYYEDIKPLFDEATVYYYSMDLVYDVDGDGENDVDVDACVAQYEKTRELLSNIEEDCALFVASSALFEDASDKEEIYAALVECYSHTTFLDETYTGVAAAKKTYDAKYAEYTGTAANIVEHIEQTNDVALSTRGNWDVDTIIAFVRSLFN